MDAPNAVGSSNPSNATATPPVPVKRGRGRPPKNRPPVGTPSTVGASIPAGTGSVSQTNNVASVQEVPKKRGRPEPPKSNPSMDSVEFRALASKNSMMFPARRSARSTTIHATQVSEGTLRPPGPPHLEAALNIALSNLESATWGYLAHYMTRARPGPLPTTNQIKEESISVRRAAIAVDKADKELEEAVDEIMRDNARKKRRVLGSKYVEQPIDSEPSTRSSTPVAKETSNPSRVVQKDVNQTIAGVLASASASGITTPAVSSHDNTPVPIVS
ncbi:hypothetical protein M422DRAFT_70956 [Sphaerobolus stellatus SS14]|uniref:Uncharacterized protein n=1 Tax=Sphaerobolus stellatus (strain SS14) TaxID=990650 RepID=A0A0C9TLG6_SPHS4|nr:hypothetical protein M422DRAFT_70956 [Sphaerobolus stellatus SS14]